jgi:hypothetical protein
MFFALIFLSELILRIAAYRCDFFTGPDMAWNLFDTMLILSQAVEQGMLGRMALVNQWGKSYGFVSHGDPKSSKIH